MNEQFKCIHKICIYKSIVYKNIGTYLSVYREPNVLRIYILKLLISSETYIKQFTIFFIKYKRAFHSQVPYIRHRISDVANGRYYIQI